MKDQKENCSKFCPLPWIMGAVRNNGDIRSCAQANSSESRGIYRKKDGSAYNINIDSLEESRNSDLVKEMRKEMLSGISPKACIRCEQEEESGIFSRRKYQQKFTKSFFTEADAKKVTSSNGTINTSTLPLKYLDLRFGNKCNTKCRMCGPTDSDQWYKDHVELWSHSSYMDNDSKVQLVLDKNNHWVPEVNMYNWVESDLFWHNVESNMKGLIYIHTVGGEPLLIDRQFDLLKKCIDLDIAKNITLEYNTNGTIIPARALKYWDNFKQVKIGISIDGINEVNDYVRYPSRFDSVEKNIDLLDNSSSNLILWFAYTVQAYNILHIPEVLKWIIKKDFKKLGSDLSVPYISGHPLHNPKHLSVKVFDAESKTKIANEMRKFYTWLDNYLLENALDNDKKEALKKSAKTIIEGYIDFMFSEDYSENLTKFWAVTKKLDHMRGESFEKTFPKLYEFIEPEITSLGIRDLKDPSGL
jgi:sulfatase maturation enzyme AslB (radical SAM superfamily)